MFPEIKDHLINIFERYTHVLDAELQQRACEYLALAQRDDNDDLLATIFDEMPVFPERESALVNRLHSRGDAAQDKRTWIIGHSTDNKERGAERFKSFRSGTGDSNGALSNVSQPVAESSRAAVEARTVTREASTNEEPMMGTSSNGVSDDIMASLAGLDLSGATIQEEPLLPSAPRTQSPLQSQASHALQPEPLASVGGSEGLKHAATLGGVAPSLLAPLTVAPNIEKVRGLWESMRPKADYQWLERLTYSSEGVLYEDDTIQIGVKSEYHGSLGRLALFFGNKVSTTISELEFTIEYPNTTTQKGLDIRFHDAPVTQIAGRTQVQELLHVECKEFFSAPPVLRMTYVTTHPHTLVLRLPVFLTRFVEGVSLEQGPFFERWKIIGGECFFLDLLCLSSDPKVHHARRRRSSRSSLQRRVRST